MNSITAVGRWLKGRGEDLASTVIAAAEVGDVVRLTQLLDEWPGLVNARGWMDTTPLIEATWHADSFAAVQLLLGRGADPLATRVNGDNALHFATSGPIAELLAEAAGQQGLAARYVFESTPLHVAVEKNRRDVVAAFLSAGADPALTARAVGRNRVTALDLTDSPEIARLLIDAGAPVQTPQPHTPLHRACARAADLLWAEVAELLLARGADPGQRDEFGDTAIDTLDLDAPKSLRARMIDILRTANRTLELELHDVAVGAHEELVIHPSLPEALSSMYSGAYLVRWRLTPNLEPVRIIKVPGRQRIRGPYGSTQGMRTAFVTDESVLLRDWRDLDIVDVLPAELRPRRMQGRATWSPDGRLLALTGGEELVVVDTEHGLRHDADDDEEIMLGDWSITAQFSPDGRRLAVGNCMQGTAWLSLIDVSAQGALAHRYEREDLPQTDHSNLVGSVVFSPDGRRFAAWIRPDHGQSRPNGYRGLVVVVDTATGDPVWHLRIDNDVTGVDGGVWWASLCFAACGSWVAVGLDTGVLWLNAETGAPATQLTSIGAVHTLASAAHTGVVATTARGVHRVPPPPR